jgi:hypothetical protein
MPTPTPTPRPAFAVRLDPANPAPGQPFEVIVQGLDPGERIEMSVAQVGQQGPFFPLAADGRGEVRTRLDGSPVAFVATVRRANGAVATSAERTSAPPTPAQAAVTTAAPTSVPTAPTAPPTMAVTPAAAPPVAAPVSSVTPPSGPLGTEFRACVAGLPAGAGPVSVDVVSPSGPSPTYVYGPVSSLRTTGERTDATGRYCLVFTASKRTFADPSTLTAPAVSVFGFYELGTHSFRASAGGVTREVTFDITASTASGTSACQPASGKAGTRFTCTWYGVAAGSYGLYETLGSETTYRLGALANAWADSTYSFARETAPSARPGTYTVSLGPLGAPRYSVTYVVTP